MLSLSRRIFLASATAAAAAFSLGASAQAQDKPQIEFLYSPFADYAPFFLAKELGYFDEFGLDVTLAPKSGTAETIQMLASGNSIAGAATWGAGLFNSIHQGATVTIVATLARMPDTFPRPLPSWFPRRPGRTVSARLRI